MQGCQLFFGGIDDLPRCEKLGNLEVKARVTQRPPSNVPYFVDNIWEWLRPPDMPSRRLSAFATPSAPLAAAAIGRNNDHVYTVHLMDGQAPLQIVNGENPTDAKYHADIRRLQRLIVRECLGEGWANLPPPDKGLAAMLFAPCLSQQEVAEIIETVELLSAD